jgi:hypothetical protein
LITFSCGSIEENAEKEVSSECAKPLKPKPPTEAEGSSDIEESTEKVG